MKRQKAVVATTGILLLGIAVWAGWLGFPHVIASYYILRLDSKDPQARRTAAEALANLGLAWTATHLVAGITESSDCSSLRVVISKMRQGVRLSTDLTDPCALAILKLGPPGARSLTTALPRLGGCERGWAILLAAEVGLDGVPTDILARVAIAEHEEETVRLIACRALETMGQGGVEALVHVVEALQGPSSETGSLDDLGERVFAAAVRACFQAQLRIMAGSSVSAAALCDAMEMPERIVEEWAFEVEFVTSSKGKEGNRVVLLEPLPKAKSQAPIVAVTSHEFRLHSWKRVEELLGWFVYSVEVENDPWMIRLRGINRGNKRVEVTVQ